MGFFFFDAEQVSDDLDCFSKTHIIGKKGAVTRIAQITQPSDASRLIMTKRTHKILWLPCWQDVRGKQFSDRAIGGIPCDSSDIKPFSGSDRPKQSDFAYT